MPAGSKQSKSTSIHRNSISASSTARTTASNTGWPSTADRVWRGPLHANEAGLFVTVNNFRSTQTHAGFRASHYPDADKARRKAATPSMPPALPKKARGNHHHGHTHAQIKTKAIS